MRSYSFFPETLRCMVGDGSIPAPKWNRPLIPIISRNRSDAKYSDDRPPPKPIQNPLLIFKHLDIVVLLLFNGVSYAAYYAVTATIAILFQTSYPFLSETEIGLCFLAIGSGSALGCLGIGKTLDWEYQQIRRKRENHMRLDLEKKIPVNGDSWKDIDFPIEKARLRSMPIYLGVFAACCVGYGWSLEKVAPLAVPLVIQFISTYVAHL